MKTTIDNGTARNNTPDNSAAVAENQQTGNATNSAVGSILADLAANWHLQRVENDGLLHLDVGGELIFDYTRARAIADRVLVDVSPLARKAGIWQPVAMTEAAWETSVRVPDGLEWQDETDRLWDVLSMLHFVMTSGVTHKKDIGFQLAIRQAAETVVNVDLKAHCHSGDEGEPVITILLPREDVLYRMQVVKSGIPTELPPDDK